jgi:hypothetical protein
LGDAKEHQMENLTAPRVRALTAVKFTVSRVLDARGRLRRQARETHDDFDQGARRV